MQVCRTIAEPRQARRQASGAVGLVPTMGYLHEGHLALAHRARAENALAVASIFVNPTQFGPHEDFARYPRALARDLDLLTGAGVDLVFTPEVAEIYPPGFATHVETGAITDVLEGASRPGHFRGVTTVVAKLFHIVQPDRAYFGHKDAQQVRVIRKMVTDLDFPVEIVVCPTVREPDGLALSSRNSYLTPEQRAAAPVLHRALRAAAARYAAGERSAETLRATQRAVLAAEPLATIDYVSVADPDTLQELDKITAGALASLAVRFGSTRLIDNVTLG